MLEDEAEEVEGDEVPEPEDSNVVLLSPEERKRLRDRNRRTREVRSKTVSVKRVSQAERDRFHLELLREGVDVEAAQKERPRTRGDCVDGLRPCIWISCRHHLALDVNPRTGSMCFTKPDVEIQDYPPGETCALDLADQGPTILERVGELLNVTRERIRQIEVLALDSFREAAGPKLAAELREHLADALNREGEVRTQDALGSDAPGNAQGVGRNRTRDRRADNIGLSAAEQRDVERWSNEVACHLREGLSLEAAQALANEEVEGVEDPPRSLVPIVDDRLPANPGSPGPRAASPREEEPGMGITEEKANELEGRSDMVLRYLRKYGPSRGLEIRESIPDATAKFLLGMVRAGEIKSHGMTNSCRYYLPGQEGALSEEGPAPRPSGPREAPRAPAVPALAKVAINASYGQGVDPVEVLRTVRAKVLEDARTKVEKIDLAIEALGGAVDEP